jgi:hypothetical protein
MAAIDEWQRRRRWVVMDDRKMGVLASLSPCFGPVNWHAGGSRKRESVLFQ